MSALHNTNRWIPVVLCMAGLGVVVGCGLLPQSSTASDRPAELVLWGDPAPGSTGEGTTIRDVNDLDDRFVVVGTDGSLQFSDGSVCNDCYVYGAIIGIDNEARMHIRFSTGPNNADVRRPYLVSTDGFYIQLLSDEEGVTFREEGLLFEAENDPTDDLAVRVGTTENPAAVQSRQAPLCGAAALMFMPLTALGMVVMRRTFRRRG